MIQMYLLDCGLLADPLAYQSLRDFGLTERRSAHIRGMKQLLARKQSFGAGLLLQYGLRLFFDRDTLADSGAHTSALPGGCGTAGRITVLTKKDVRGMAGAEAAQMGAWLDAHIAYNDYGKPYLAMRQNAPQPAFSLSHSGSYVLLAVGDGELLGCDIEKIKAYRPHLAKRFFSENECMALASLHDCAAQAALFYRYWTRRESVLKLTGLGMALPMELFDVSRDMLTVPDAAAVRAWAAGCTKAPAHCAQAADMLLHGGLAFFDDACGEYSISLCCDSRSIFTK